MLKVIKTRRLQETSMCFRLDVCVCVSSVREPVWRKAATWDSAAQLLVHVLLPVPAQHRDDFFLQLLHQRFTLRHRHSKDWSKCALTIHAQRTSAHFVPFFTQCGHAICMAVATFLSCLSNRSSILKTLWKHPSSLFMNLTSDPAAFSLARNMVVSKKYKDKSGCNASLKLFIKAAAFSGSWLTQSHS